MVSDGPKYASDSAAVIEWWHDARERMDGFFRDADRWAEECGMGREPVIFHGWGMQLAGVEATTEDATAPPAGWRLIPAERRRCAHLVPLRRSKAGKALYDSMTKIVVNGDPRHKLPGWEWDFNRPEPGLFLWDGVVWMSAGTDDGVDLDVWTRIPNSEYWLAHEAHTAERKASA